MQNGDYTWLARVPVIQVKTSSQFRPNYQMVQAVASISELSRPDSSCFVKEKQDVVVPDLNTPKFPSPHRATPPEPPALASETSRASAQVEYGTPW